jgi:hypothetical protein
LAVVPTQSNDTVPAHDLTRTEPFDDLKYIPLSPDDPKSYVSFGLDLRERFESVNAASFGVRGIPVQDINCQTRDLTVNARSASAPPTAVEKMVDGLAFCQLSLIS